LTDGIEFVTLIEWEKSSFINFNNSTIVSISNAFFKKMILNQYTQQINRNNIVLELNSISTVVESKTDTIQYEK
jgi:hypothetical protein